MTTLIQYGSKAYVNKEHIMRVWTDKYSCFFTTINDEYPHKVSVKCLDGFIKTALEPIKTYVPVIQPEPAQPEPQASFSALSEIKRQLFWGSPDEALDWCNQQEDPLAALMKIVAHNLEFGESGFASELCAMSDLLEGAEAQGPGEEDGTWAKGWEERSNPPGVVTRGETK